MKLIPRSARLLAVLLVLGAAGLLAGKPSAPAGAPGPKLAGVIAVDGLSMPRLMAWRPWWTAGLKRLLDEGTVETNAKYRHLNTETGPGHASLGTGAPPRVHGIAINSWFEERPGRGMVSVYCTDQPDSAAPADSVRVIAGPANLRVPTLGDRLVEARSGSRVVAVSGKDRAAIFLAGKNPRHAAYWYDKARGTFTTSAAYDTKSGAGAAAAAVVDRFNRDYAGGMLPARIGLLWKRWDAPPPPSPRPLPAPVASAILQRFQVGSVGLGWDKDLSKFVSWSRSEPSGYFAGIYRSPFLDDLTADLAQALLADPGLALGRRDVPDLLAVSFSAHDPVAHDYGDESEESLDTLRRLDVQIGRFLDALAREVPAGSLLVAFSADHGFAPIPEAARKLDRTAPGGRLVGSRDYADNVVDRLNRMIDDELCLDRSAQPIHGIEGWSLFYRHTVFPLKTVEGPCGAAGRPVTEADVDRVLPKLVKARYDEEVAQVLLVRQKDSWPADSPALEFVRNDLDATRSGEVLLVPRPGVLTISDPGRGSMHGTHHDTDTHVPLVFWGGPAKAGASAAPVTPYDLAPTVGAWLGVAVPDATGRVIPLGK
ncbi:MAG TPA: alkaline phosphatase family protein [Thermoanaerobaculia bacterium]|nr:alkaline phosphatase family protein [Thermoanaerobaculia bacterium]